MSEARRPAPGPSCAPEARATAPFLAVPAASGLRPSSVSFTSLSSPVPHAGGHTPRLSRRPLPGPRTPGTHPSRSLACAAAKAADPPALRPAARPTVWDPRLVRCPPFSALGPQSGWTLRARRGPRASAGLWPPQSPSVPGTPALAPFTPRLVPEAHTIAALRPPACTPSRPRAAAVGTPPRQEGMRGPGVRGPPPPRLTRSPGPASRPSFLRGATSSGRSRCLSRTRSAHVPALRRLVTLCLASPLHIVSHTPHTTLTLVPSPLRPLHARFKCQRQLQSIFPAPPLGPKMWCSHVASLPRLSAVCLG